MLSKPGVFLVASTSHSSLLHPLAIATFGSSKLCGRGLRLLGVGHCACNWKVTVGRATMTFSAVLALHYTIMCILVCICSLQTVVIAFDQPASLHLTYYAYETRYGPNATLLAAAGTGQGNFSANGWGSFLVYEHPLKEGPSPDSKLLGKITGTAAITTIGGIATGGVKLAAEHIFNEASQYSGSSLTLTGTFGFPPQGWELIVPGGTGQFRGFRGYALGESVVATTVPPLYVYKWDIYLSK